MKNLVLSAGPNNPSIKQIDNLIAETKRRFNVPVSAYSVSGEYALVKGAAMQGWINEGDMTKEILYFDLYLSWLKYFNLKLL